MHINDEYLSDTCVYNRDVYESKTPDNENLSKGVLRVITGPVAEWDTLNRNNRKYSEKLWDKVLKSPYVKEQLKYHTLYGEANHPTDRYEIDFGRVSHSITDMWKVPASNQIYATINILDTPLGRILDTLYESGGVIGYSSRAGGKLINKGKYIEVDEDSYNFVTFDAVPFPSVESARPDEIKEGVDFKHRLPEKVHESLCNIIESSSQESKNIIKEFLSSLTGLYDLSIEESLLNDKGLDNKTDYIKDNIATLQILNENSQKISMLKAENQGLKAQESSLREENLSLRKSLDESLQHISNLISESSKSKTAESESKKRYDNTINELHNRIISLESEIEDRDADIEYLESLKQYNRAVSLKNKNLTYQLNENAKITESVGIYQENEKSLRESINLYERKINELENDKKLMESKNIRLIKDKESLNSEIDKLNSIINNINEESETINESLSKENRRLTSNIESVKSSYKEKIKELNESIEILENQLQDKEKELDDVFEKSDRMTSNIYKLNEELSRMENYISDKEDYILECQDSLVSVISDNYNISKDIVKSKLPSNFTKGDVYNVCESIVNSAQSSPGFISILESDNNSVNVDSHAIKNIFPSGNRRGI